VNSKVSKFLEKSKNWPEETAKLRAVLLKTKLEENLKWNLPCYSYNGSNVVIIQPFKSYLALMFFKGSLLKDPKRVLFNNGPNSQAAKRFEFRSMQDIVRLTPTIKNYIKEAIALEAAGKKVKFKRKPESLPAELKAMFKKKPALKQAFATLTPGRQRAYILHFIGAIQPLTRISRIQKCMPRILQGKGLNDI